MYSFDYDLKYLNAGLDDLEAYLLARDLYWNIRVSPPHGGSPYPQLTLGGLLLARQRARATAQTPAQQAELEHTDHELHTMRARWRTAWGHKAHVELHARLNLWRDFLEEYREKPSAHFDRYPYEIGRRVQIELLQPESEALTDAENQALRGLDELLRAVFNRGAFTWQADLASQFPPRPFWYLYGGLRQETA
jgi:hypothetical protein